MTFPRLPAAGFALLTLLIIVTTALGGVKRATYPTPAGGNLIQPQVPKTLTTRNTLVVNTPHFVMVPGVCDASVACPILHDGWPVDKTFTCGSKSIPAATFSLTTLSMYSDPREAEEIAWPSDFQSEACNNAGSDVVKRTYRNGMWTSYYFIQKSCGCADTSSKVPTCSGTLKATTETGCNTATFHFCAMRRGNETCSF